MYMCASAFAIFLKPPFPLFIHVDMRHHRPTVFLCFTNHLSFRLFDQFLTRVCAHTDTSTRIHPPQLTVFKHTYQMRYIIIVTHSNPIACPTYKYATRAPNIHVNVSPLTIQIRATTPALGAQPYYILPTETYSVPIARC